ncbi:hypothetical protein JOQ06_024866, partial [Pogonophryne albipinna]
MRAELIACAAGVVDYKRGDYRDHHYVAAGAAFANFISHIYATWWLTCDTAVDAAWNDLTLTT